MATLRKRGKSWEAQVFVKGQRATRSFDTKAQAQAWAVVTEQEFRAVQAGAIPSDKSFGDLIERYAKEISPTKRSEKFEVARINALIKSEDPIIKVKLCRISSADVSDWRDRRLQRVSADSVLREWTLFSHACTVAKKDWAWLRDNPFREARRPKGAQARDRRFEEGELDRLLLALGADPQIPPSTTTARVGFALLFALQTAMRAGEICNLTWADIKDNVATLHETKNGNPRKVPLSTEARRLLTLLPQGEPTDRVFQLEAKILDALFRKAKARALIDDLHFHDSRREALTRLSQKVDVMTLAKISGHRDLRILQNTYYAPRMEDVAAQLD